MAAVAVTYGLLQLPKMPEFKNQDTSNFPKIDELDLSKISYKDKQRECMRQEKLKEYQNTGKS